MNLFFWSPKLSLPNLCQHINIFFPKLVGESISFYFTVGMCASYERIDEADQRAEKSNPPRMFTRGLLICVLGV